MNLDYALTFYKPSAVRWRGKDYVLMGHGVHDHGITVHGIRNGGELLRVEVPLDTNAHFDLGVLVIERVA